MNKKLQKGIVAAVAASLGTGIVAPVYAASAETTDLASKYAKAYEATVAAKTQKELTEARKLVDALYAEVKGTANEYLATTLSSLLDPLQQKELVKLDLAIKAAEASATQANVNAARALIVDMPEVWRNAFSSYIDTIQNKLIANAIDAAKKAQESGSQADLDAAKALYTELLTVTNNDGVKSWVETALKAELDKVVVELKVQSVSALNLKQVEVKFNKVVDKEDAEDEDNYAVYNAGGTTNLVTGGTATLKADGKTVVITLGTALNNGTTAKVEVDNFVTYSNDAVSVSDTTVPTIVGIQVSGPKTFTVEYSEPITNLNDAEFTVDDGNYIVTGSVANGSNKVDVTVGVNFTDGEHKVKFNGTNIADYAGYRVVPRTSTFTVAADTTAPTVSVKSASPTQVVLKFSKPVANVDDANIAYRHTFNNDTYAYAGNEDLATAGTAFVTVNSSTEITLDFSEMPIPLGANKLYIAYTSSTGTKVEDLWGNDLAAVALDVNVTLDTVKPAVKEVKFVDNATLDVYFTEALDTTTAETEANYVVKDSSGDEIAVQTATLDAENNKVTLGFNPNDLAGGSYSITVKNVKDTALVKNTMDEYTTTLSVNDTVKPTVLDSKYYINSSDPNHNKVVVYVPFSEAMSTSTLVKGNFMKNINDAGLVALGSNDTVAVGADGKSVTITIDNGTTVIDTVDNILVGAVKDQAGNGLATFTASSAAGNFALATDSIAVESVEAIGTKKIVVTFDGRLKSVSATGYSLVEKDSLAGTASNIALSVVSHVINDDNKSEVTFALGSALAADATFGTDAIQLVVNGATGTKSFLGTQVSNLAYAQAAVAAADVQDAIVPTLSDVTVDSATQITLTFSELIESDTLAATLNGFSVAGGSAKLTGVSIAGDSTTITLTGTGFIDGTTTVSYNSVAGLEDVAGNKLAAFDVQK